MLSSTELLYTMAKAIRYLGVTIWRGRLIDGVIEMFSHMSNGMQGTRSMFADSFVGICGIGKSIPTGGNVWCVVMVDWVSVVVIQYCPDI